MLKKNLVSAVISKHGWLLFIPVVTAMSSVSYSVHEARSNQQSWKDTANLPTSDTTMLISTETDFANAPKISMNKNASKFVSSFMKKDAEELAIAKQRSSSYFKTIDEIFARYDLPLELKYLAVVESNLKTNAVSKMGAKGMWQLMPVTARELGLKVNGKQDERMQFYKSTVAAAKYLKSLYAEFNDWLLVIAAYNSGPGTVYKAMKKSGSKNFWAMQSYLPEESRGHVKRFIGTHYYFEGKGSLVTLTNAETIKYNKALADFKLEMETKEEKKDSTDAIVVKTSR